MRARMGLKAGVSLVMLSLLGVTAAFAQGVGSGGLGSGGLGGPASPTVPPSLSPSPGVVGQAPVGHLQPRRDTVPTDEDNPFKETPEDKALDRKIKSICRGC